MWPFNLSVRLLIVALVGRYPANKLIRYEPIFQRIAPLVSRWCHPNTLCGISSRFQLLSPSERQVAHTLLTRPPLSHIQLRRISVKYASFDLHVLGTPPAFILSQDQTLKYSLSFRINTGFFFSRLKLPFFTVLGSFSLEHSLLWSSNSSDSRVLRIFEVGYTVQLSRFFVLSLSSRSQSAYSL